MTEAAHTLVLLGTTDLRDAAGRSAARVQAQPKRLALLVFLALQGDRFVRRADLLDLFWPDIPDDRARNSLSQSLHHLREHLGTDLVEVRGAEELRLMPGRVRCDAVQARADAEAGRHEAAVAAWAGELCAGFRPEIGRAFDRWLEDERSALRQRLTRSALEAASHATMRGAPDEAWALLQRAHAQVPLDDGVMQALLAAALAAGHRAEALVQYERFTVELAALDLEPAPETTAAAAALRAEVESPDTVGTSPWSSSGGIAAATRSAPAAARTAPEQAPMVPVAAPAVKWPSARMVAALLVMLVVIMAAIANVWRRKDAPAPAAAPATPDRVLVAEFENRTGRDDLALLGAVAQDWISARLIRAGDTAVVDGPTALLLWRRRQDAGETLASLTEREGVGLLLTGTMVLDGGEVVAQARLVELPSARVISVLGPRRAAVATPLVAIERLADDAILAVARTRDPRFSEVLAPTEPLPSLEAYQEFVRGVNAYVQRDLPVANEHFVRAAALDTGFMAPRLYAATSFRSWSDSTNPYLDQLLARLDRLPEHFRLRVRLLDAFRGRRLAESHALAEELVTRWPNTDGPYLATRVHIATWRVRTALRHLIALDPERGWMRGWHTYWLSRTMAAHVLGDLDEERRSVRLARAQYPTLLSPLAAAARLAGARGDAGTVTALLDTARTLERGAGWGWSLANLSAVAVAEADAHGHGAMAAEFREWTRRWYAALPPEERAREEGEFSHTYNLYLAGLFTETRARCADAGLHATMSPYVKIVCANLALTVGDTLPHARLVRELGDLLSLPMIRAMTAASRGQADDALRLLAEARASQVGFSAYLHVDPILGTLRQRPEFARLVAPRDR